MGNLAAWLISMVVPIVKRALVGLGIGTITYAGYSAVASQVTSAVQNAWSGLAPTTLQLLSIAGFGQGLGIVLGAISARAALLAYAKFGKLTS